VTINSPAGGELTIGQNFVAGNNATILGGSSTTKVVIGDNVTIGNGAVVSGTSLGSGSTVGDHAYVFDSTFPAGTKIPAAAIYENNKLVGFVAWQDEQTMDGQSAAEPHGSRKGVLTSSNYPV